MDDLQGIFDQSISDIDIQEKKSREEGKKIIQERGIREILEYIVSRVKETNKTENDKKLTEELVQIAKNMFFNKNGKSLKGDVKNIFIEESEYLNRNIYGLNIKIDFYDFGDWYNVSRLVLDIYYSNNELWVYRKDKNKEGYYERIEILSGDTKTVIAQKIIKLILTGKGDN